MTQKIVGRSTTPVAGGAGALEPCPGIQPLIDGIRGALEALQRLTPALADLADAPASAPALDRLLPLPEVAARVSIPVRCCYELARRGILPTLRVGKYVRVPEADLARWIDGQRKGLDVRSIPSV